MNAHRDFSAAVRKALARKGIRVIGSVAVPAFDGDRYFSGVAYTLDDNGTHCVRQYREVLAMSEA